MSEKFMNDLADELRNQIVTVPVVEPAMAEPTTEEPIIAEPIPAEAIPNEAEPTPNTQEWWDNSDEPNTGNLKPAEPKVAEPKFELDDDLKLISEYKKSGKTLADFVKEYQIDDYAQWADDKIVKEGLKEFMNLTEEEIEQANYEYDSASIFQKKQWAENFKQKFDNKNGFVLVSNEGMAEVTPATIQGKIDQHKPDLVILDYHQLFSDNKKSMGATERNMNISREFKMLAMTNNIPVIDITAATMDDVSDQDNPPMLSQVAWSKAIEYDADMAIAIHKYTGTQMIEVVSRKNRHGQEFGMYLDWDINRGIVKEIYENPFANDAQKN